jgi:GDP-fucose transporter C1
LGIVLGFLSAVTLGLHAILIKDAIKKFDGKTLDMAYWGNALSAVVMLPALVVAGEVQDLTQVISGTRPGLLYFVIGSGVTVSFNNKGYTDS